MFKKIRSYLGKFGEKDKGGVAKGAIAGIIGSELFRSVFGQVREEVVKEVGQAVVSRLKIGKKGKGIGDEIIFCDITLGGSDLNVDQRKKLDNYLEYLQKHDRKHKTKLHENFILFIAKGSEQFEKSEEYPYGRGKNKKVVTKEVRVTRTSIGFLKEMLLMETSQKMLKFCERRRVFAAHEESILSRLGKIIGVPHIHNIEALVDKLPEIKEKIKQRVGRVDTGGIKERIKDATTGLASSSKEYGKKAAKAVDEKADELGEWIDQNIHQKVEYRGFWKEAFWYLPALEAKIKKIKLPKIRLSFGRRG